MEWNDGPVDENKDDEEDHESASDVTPEETG